MNHRAYASIYAVIHNIIAMSTRKLEDRSIRKLIRTSGGRSFSLTLPIEEVRALKWHERQNLVVKREGKTLVIKDWKPAKRRLS